MDKRNEVLSGDEYRVDISFESDEEELSLLEEMEKLEKHADVVKTNSPQEPQVTGHGSVENHHTRYPLAMSSTTSIKVEVENDTDEFCAETAVIHNSYKGLIRCNDRNNHGNGSVVKAEPHEENPCSDPRSVMNVDELSSAREEKKRKLSPSRSEEIIVRPKKLRCPWQSEVLQFPCSNGNLRVMNSSVYKPEDTSHFEGSSGLVDKLHIKKPKENTLRSCNDQSSSEIGRSAHNTDITLKPTESKSFQDKFPVKIEREDDSYDTELTVTPSNPDDATNCRLKSSPIKSEEVYEEDTLPPTWSGSLYAKVQLCQNLSTKGENTNALPSVDLIQEDRSSQEESMLHMKEDPKLTIQYLNQSSKQACYYCGKYMLTVARHMLNAHSGEDEIAFVNSLPEYSPNREYFLKYLRLKGNYLHNMRCLEKGEGTVIVMKSPKCEANVSDFIPCPYCYGFLAKWEMVKHVNSCPFAPDLPHVNAKFVTATACSPNNRVDNLQNLILGPMKEDEIKSKILGDGLILTFGNNLISKVHISKGEQYIRSLSYQLRQLGSLLIEAEKVTGYSMFLQDLLTSSKFDLLISCIQNLVLEENDEWKLQAKPIMMKLCYAIKRCAVIARLQAIKSKNSAVIEDMEGFLELWEGEWRGRIKDCLREDFCNEKPNKNTVLQLTSDIQKLLRYMDESLESLMGKMDQNLCEVDYFDLAKVAFSKLTFFNSRRMDEVSRIIVQDFLNHQELSTVRKEPIYASFNDLEKKLSERLDFIKVAGKRGRPVLLLLTPDVKDAMDMLMKNRAHFVDGSNKYFFANGGRECLIPFDTLSEVVGKSEVSYLSALTNVHLREFAATVSQVVSLDKDELEWLAVHLGVIVEDLHSVRECSLSLSKLSKLLLSTEGGTTSAIVVGKRLNEVELETCFLDEEIEAAEVILLNQVKCKKLSHPDNSPDEKMIVQLDSSCRQQKVGIKKRKPKRKSCDTSLRELAIEHFEQYITQRKTPGKTECEHFLKLYKSQDREWKEIKYLIRNAYQGSHSEQQQGEQIPRIRKKANKTWDPEVKMAAKKHFKTFIAKKRAPGKVECEHFLEMYEIQGRTWKDIKYLIKNSY